MCRHRSGSTARCSPPNRRWLKSDYAEWMLDDPRVNFAISKRGGDAGVRHLGIQVESEPELHEVYGRLSRAEARYWKRGQDDLLLREERESWIEDPQGVQWETFLTTGREHRLRQ